VEPRRAPAGHARVASCPHSCSHDRVCSMDSVSRGARAGLRAGMHAGLQLRVAVVEELHARGCAPASMRGCSAAPRRRRRRARASCCSAPAWPAPSCRRGCCAAARCALRWWTRRAWRAAPAGPPPALPPRGIPAAGARPAPPRRARLRRRRRASRATCTATPARPAVSCQLQGKHEVRRASFCMLLPARWHC